MKYKFLIITFLAVIVASCSQKTVLPMTSSPTIMKEATASKTPTPQPTPTTINTATSNPKADIKLSESCVRTVNQLDTIPDGIIVLTGRSDNSPLFLYNLKTGQNTYIGHGSS